MKQPLLLFLFLPLIVYSQVSQDVSKDTSRYVFAQIFTDFRYGFNDDVKPQAAFGFNQGILGYYHELSDKVSGKIMFDVTRTTHIYEIADSSGNLMNINYFEGSKYTAYLKLAEIKWDINKMFILRVGQLLNTQYLTFTDRFWGFRYIDVTFQERFRLGNPADFGAQLDIKLGDKIINQFSVVNGEGPFRHQDLNGKFLYSYNIQYYPVKGLILKLYADYAPAPDTGDDMSAKSVISGMVGYKNEKFRMGGEFDYVLNQTYMKDVDFYGFSVFAVWKFIKQFELLARYDRLYRNTDAELKQTNYYIAGLQYTPVDKFFTSLNFRYFSDEELPMIFASFGLKF